MGKSTSYRRQTVIRRSSRPQKSPNRLSYKVKLPRSYLRRPVDEVARRGRGRPRIHLKLNGKTIPGGQRFVIWTLFYGNRVKHSCLSCSREIGFDNFDLAHIVARSKDLSIASDVRNVVPICRPCNNQSRTQNLFEWIKDKHPKSPLLKFLKHALEKRPKAELHTYLECLRQTYRDHTFQELMHELGILPDKDVVDDEGDSEDGNNLASLLA